MRTELIACALVAATLPQAASAATGPDEFVVYRAKRGDTLYGLAHSYLLRDRDYAIVQQINRVRNPRRMAIGTVLRVPRRLLRYTPIDATVIAFRGSAQVVHSGRPLAVAVGMRVSENDVLSTARNSFLSLRLPDASVVTLPSQSSVRIERLRQVIMTGAVDRRFLLQNGRARAVVTPATKSDDTFEVTTPVAVSAVRGTEFRVAYEAGADRSVTEVLNGKVDVQANTGGAAKIPAGFGAIATEVGVQGTRLLAPPRLLQPERVQEEADLAFSIEPVPAASQYHVQIARDAGLLDVVRETFVSEPHASIEGPPDGTWFVQITAIDANGLEGEPATYSFERSFGITETSEVQHRVGRFHEYLFRWRTGGDAPVRQFRFQLYREDSRETPMIDEAGLTGDGFIATDLPPGTYVWRVMTVRTVRAKAQSTWSPFQRLIIGGRD